MTAQPKNPAPQPAIGRSALIWPIVLIALGSGRLYLGDQTTFSRTWCIGMIVVGGLCLLLLILGKWSIAVGKRMARHATLLDASPHEFGDATEADFARANRDFYEAATVDLTSAGFRLVRDAINLTVANVTSVSPLPIRYFLGDGGATRASVYEMKMQGSPILFQWLGIAPRRLRIVECESELNDGTFVTTLNTAGTRPDQAFPFIDRQSLPMSTRAAEVIRQHREHVRAVLASKRGVVMLQVNSFAEIQESNYRQRTLRAGFRQSPKFNYPATWEAMMTKSNVGESAKQLPSR